MSGISEFANLTAASAKDAVKLYFQPLVTLADIIFASRGKRPKFFAALRQIVTAGTESEKTGVHRIQRSS